jgi:hypothetical protein
MKPSGFLDAAFTEWLTAYALTTSAFRPSDGEPQPVKCKNCGGIMLGIAGTENGTIVTREVVRMTDGMTFGIEPAGEHVYHRGHRRFTWKCDDCLARVKLSPAKG